ncbi:N-acetylmuramic acid 6-phosphate etherase [Luteipulveratus halotolerans]|uniref:N-acetylmuramic acid 6-phosphate etherase n=1 Tax=Luteipulveratus halotolerans TaxID=1631356 RepID=A0A0L6CMY3_9MICO|nr:N-acetylmuramic acid 6-phosphate etherase [Luteipulveratus halotolerans]KNX38908.1 N-acetylmuramic acid-6-phosphate etherase [Luteipulveratus halotolerans]
MTSSPVDPALAGLATEGRNPSSQGLDRMTTAELVALMNAEDAGVASAVAQALPQVTAAVDLVARSIHDGGRLVYIGAGTSGRLALLDAAECPPTFSTDPAQVITLLAGGEQAFTQAVEGAEDDTDAAAQDIDAAGVGPLDTVVGLTASGRTPYVVAGLDRARELGAPTVSISCNAGSVVSGHADVAIEVVTGPEVLTGSTRLKAGTAQKMVCNMLTTASMVRNGKTFKDLMVDMRPTNGKLLDRARRIVAAAADVDVATAGAALDRADGSTKVAIVMLLTGRDARGSQALLAASDGVVSAALAGRTG